MFDPFLDQLGSWLEQIFSLEGLVQVGALVLILLVAWLLRGWILKRLTRLKEHVAQRPAGQELPWLCNILPILHKVMYPLLVWVLAAVTAVLFKSLDLNNVVLTWLEPFLLLWIGYRLLAGLVHVRIGPERALGWERQILRPLAVITGALLALGLWDDFLALGIQLGEDMLITMRSLLIGLTIFSLFWMLARYLRQFLHEAFFPRAGIEPALNQVISTLVSYAVAVTGFVMGLRIIGIDLTSFTLIAGGLSVGIGFGLQELMNNLISGVILLFERSIGPGDMVYLGDTEGVIENVGLRSTLVRTRDNIELIVPNGQFLSEIVTNYSRSDRNVRIHIGVGISYDSKPRQIENLLLEAAAHPLALEDPAPTVLFVEFGDSSLNFELLLWTDQLAEIPTLSSDIRYKIWDLFEQHDIEIPFPQRDIHIRTVPPRMRTIIR